MKLRTLFIAQVVAALCLILAAMPSTAEEAPAFMLGFRLLADRIPAIVGSPMENEHWGANGDSLQQTSTGLMVWRKADNWTAFTNGSGTWINGPYGVQDRGNEERFPWEAAPPATSPAAPISTTIAPSDYDIVQTEAIIGQPDGSRLYRSTLSNINHYWSATDIAVTLTLRDKMGIAVLETQARSDISGLGPLQEATWEFLIPSSASYETASGNVSFRWRPPGS